ncbi:MAG: molybdenum cofactor biosynthesis protein MoaE [Ardenticatenales bacterium]|nr:molybdenum cofactor biosynthesis protein MoaE [Ardenticatenales bacterium]
MIINVRLFAGYREAVGAKTVTVEVAEGATLGDVWAVLAARHERLRPFSASVVGSVNAEYAPLDTPLTEGDEVAFLPPVAGGDHFAITEQPIDEAQLRQAVEDPGAGAVLTFLGTTRNQTGQRQVAYLEYEAYPELAQRQMAVIAEEIRTRWPGVRGVAIVHRVGHLEIGEASIGIAISTPHRGEAFAACRYAIDRAKEQLPIWKKEAWEGGEEWIEEGPGGWG